MEERALLAMEELLRLWRLTEFPDERTANLMRLDLAMTIVAVQDGA